MAVETGKFDPLWNADEWHEYLMHNLTVEDYVKLCNLIIGDLKLIEKRIKNTNNIIKKEQIND